MATKKHHSGEDPDERNDRFDVSYVRSTCLLHLLLFVANAWLRHLGVLPDANTCTWQESLYPASLSHVVHISMDTKEEIWVDLVAAKASCFEGEKPGAKCLSM